VSSAGTWRPALGAWCEGGGVRFRVWAPERERVELVLEDAGAAAAPPLERDADGYWSGFAPALAAGARYRYRLDGEGPFPDPASRFQPEGVHGASQVVDASRFAWSDRDWRGVALEDLVVYELHVGSFTPAGSFAGVAARLPELVGLGVTAVELMPLGDFPGNRNWGYDGVDLFAPARCYGTPDDLRRLVEHAHNLGLAVLGDVVYNHLGPDGAYLGLFSPGYFNPAHPTPWGAAVNLDGPASAHARAFFVENALHWIHEYRFDGLRLDACHALVDDSERHFLAELQARARETVTDRQVLVIAEDSRNLVSMVRPESADGWGLDAVWADDLHHQLRVHLAGDRDGYYADFAGSSADIARTLRDGWFFQGQPSRHFGGPRGTDPTPAHPQCFVVCLQNHDQVGNRALGERLHQQIDAAAWRAASTLLLLAPETPLLFMGQEWGASSPFLYFTDHNPQLGRLVTQGRRREFAGFAAFSDPATRERIPDPQAEATFAASRLDWVERECEPHAGQLRLHQALLALRRELTAARRARGAFDVSAHGEDGLVLDYRPLGEAPTRLTVAVWLRGAGGLVLAPAVAAGADRGAAPAPSWSERLSTEDARFVADPHPIGVQAGGSGLRVSFARPGAVVLSSPAVR
jgi:maltooligosyltrehalose trehalohydrolase